MKKVKLLIAGFLEFLPYLLQALIYVSFGFGLVFFVSFF